MKEILLVIELIVLVFIGLQVAYFTIFGFASLFYVSKKYPANDKYKSVAVLIPGYKEDRIIVNTARMALQQDYPAEQLRVLVLADSFEPATITELKKLPVEVLPVSFESSTKAKSINKGLEYLEADPPEVVVVLDSDNIMLEGFLQKVNCAFQAGCRVVQGHRTAKNQETAFALLDAINEEIGNSIFRSGHRALGISSGLIGSGMAFDFHYYRELMRDVTDVAGEDKLLELRILKQEKKIEYLGDAIVLDEKVSNASTFAKQRTRWVGVQLYFLKHYFFNGIKNLFTRGNLGYFDKAFQMALIPKVLLIGLCGVMGVLALLGHVHILWFYYMLFYYFALLFAIPRRFYNWRLVVAIVNIPKAIFFMILSIMRIRKSTASKFEVTEKKLN